jgi:hypothetical protein
MINVKGHLFPARDLHTSEGVVIALSDPVQRQAFFDSISGYLAAAVETPLLREHQRALGEWGRALEYTHDDSGIWFFGEYDETRTVIIDGVETVPPLPQYFSAGLAFGRKVQFVGDDGEIGERFEPGFADSTGRIWPAAILEVTVTTTPRFDVGQSKGQILLTQSVVDSGAALFTLSQPQEGERMTPDEVNAVIEERLRAMLPGMIAEALAAQTPAVEVVPVAPVVDMANGAPPVAPVPDPTQALMAQNKALELLLTRPDLASDAKAKAAILGAAKAGGIELAQTVIGAMPVRTAAPVSRAGVDLSGPPVNQGAKISNAEDRAFNAARNHATGKARSLAAGINGGV